jgi:hypothetical protein
MVRKYVCVCVCVCSLCVLLPVLVYVKEVEVLYVEWRRGVNCKETRRVVS